MSYSYTGGQTVISDANSNRVKHNYSRGKLSSVEDQTAVTDANSNLTGWAFGAMCPVRAADRLLFLANRARFK